MPQRDLRRRTFLTGTAAAVGGLPFMTSRGLINQILAGDDGGALGPAANFVAIDADELIAQGAADIAACWHVAGGSEVSTVEPTVALRLPQLEGLASHGPWRQRAAGLVAQGYILAALAAVLRCDHGRALRSSQRAVNYAVLAEDSRLQAAAMKHLATRYQDAGHQIRALHTYQEAQQLEDRMSPLLRSRIHLGLALVLARCGDEYASSRHLQLAEDTFPDEPQADPSFTYADCGRSSLNHYGGLIHLAFNRPAKAWEAFHNLRTLEGAPVPERTVLEILNCQAAAAVAQGELDLAADHIVAAVDGACRLRSEMRFQEVRRVFETMRAVWPAEPRVRELEPLLQR